MALRVIIDGKPCAGKTTISKVIEEKLSSQQITTLDAKSYAMEKGFLSGFLKKFSEGEIDSFRTVFHSAVRHALSYIALEQSTWANRNKYEVMIIQRSPYAFSFMMEAVKVASGHGNYSYKPSGILYDVIEAWAKFVKPDLFIYLTADVETLRERFKNRPDGKDRIHKMMIEQDDSEHIKLLKRYMRGTNFVVVDNTSSISSATEKIIPVIKETLNAKTKARSYEGIATTNH
ncbi:MAG: AAA family ATPase [Candidatus Micrarchaeaceae archaeon]